MPAFLASARKVSRPLSVSGWLTRLRITEGGAVITSAPANAESFTWFGLRMEAAQIEALDQAWRAEIGQATQPTIAPVMTNAASDVLRARIAASGGRVTEAFVMDALGLNVATASATSDYWQGDEAKFSETYPKGAEAMHLGEVEFDESSQSYQMQISFTVPDPASGAPIGAMTVAVDAEQMN